MLRTIAHWLKIIGFSLFGLLALLLLGSLLPLRHGYQLRIVQTGSMRPTIPVGSVVVVMAAPQYHVGDILTFQRTDDKEATTHRLVQITTDAAGQTVFIVRGDANNANDLRPVKPSEVVGKTRLILPVLGYLLVFIRSPFGFLLVIGMPAVYIIWTEGRRIMVEVRKVRSENSST